MILIKVSELLEEKLTKLNFTWKKVNDFKELTKLEDVSEELFIIGSDAAVSYDYFALKTFLEKNWKFIVECKNDTDLNIKKKISAFGLLSFVRSSVDIIELEVLLNSLDIFQLNRMQGQGLAGHLINQIPNPVFIKNLRGKFFACNDAFCKFVGYDRSDILGRPTSILTTNRKAHIYDEIDRLVIETRKERQNESKIILKDQSIVTVLVNRSPLTDSDNKVQGIMGVVTDISQQKKREKQLKEKKQKASESDKLKTSFLSNMSHEIRTPMNAIVGFSQLLANKNLTQEKKEIFIDQINHNANQLLKLIEDIIEVSKIEAGKVKMSPGVTHINDILDELRISFDAHRARMGKNHIELIVHKGVEKGPLAVISDPYRLKQIITNLLGNSFKFTEEGKITFGYNFVTEDNKKYLEFFVKDTGIGIIKDKLKYVFDRFSKIPANKTKLYGGTGLGLSISYNLTKMLGGEMSVESEENIGTKFIFTIPYKKVDTQYSGGVEHHDTSQKKKNYFWANKILYIVEDEEMNYLYLNEILKDKGLKVVWLENGYEFLKKVEQQKPDLVLMDIKMPKMDGYEATSKFKKIHPEIPVIIQTAYAMKHEKKKGFEAGGDQYLEKPVDQKLLLNEIERFLS